MDWLGLGFEAAGLCRAGFMNLVILKDLSLKSLLQPKQSHDSKELLHLLSENRQLLPCSPKNCALVVPLALHKPKGLGQALCAWCWREDAHCSSCHCPAPGGCAGLRQGWARGPHGLWPLASPSAGQGWATTPALDLISIFITAALGKNEKVSYICVHVLVSIVSHDPPCHILLLQHPSEIAFLNRETQLHGVCKGL